MPYHLFLLCHEGEIPYVIHGLKDTLCGVPEVHIVGQGSTQKMHMGYVLLHGTGEPPAALFRELLANEEIYLYSLHQPGATVEGSAETADKAGAEEYQEPDWWKEPLPEPVES